MKSNKTLYDLFPVVVFFIGYLFGDIYTATAGLIIATPIQVLTYRYFNGTFDNTQLITMVLIFIFGAATLVFHNPLFIQWKVTILYWVFALILLGSHLFTPKCVMEYMLAGKINVPTPILKRANYAWGIFFIWFGCLNLYIVYNYSQKVWVYFKMFGAMGILLIASLIFALYVSRHMTEE